MRGMHVYSVGVGVFKKAGCHSWITGGGKLWTCMPHLYKNDLGQMSADV